MASSRPPILLSTAAAGALVVGAVVLHSGMPTKAQQAEVAAVNRRARVPHDETEALRWAAEDSGAAADWWALGEHLRQKRQPEAAFAAYLQCLAVGAGSHEADCEHEANALRNEVQ